MKEMDHRLKNKHIVPVEAFIHFFYIGKQLIIYDINKQNVWSHITEHWHDTIWERERNKSSIAGLVLPFITEQRLKLPQKYTSQVWTNSQVLQVII
jgi:hypothetical protein